MTFRVDFDSLEGCGGCEGMRFKAFEQGGRGPEAAPASSRELV